MYVLQNISPLRRFRINYGRLYILSKVMRAEVALNLLFRSPVVRNIRRGAYVSFLCRFFKISVLNKLLL